jgi:DNA-binding response OmpR family regulator
MTRRVLVADDEPYIRLLILQTLEELEDDGVEFSSAVNGQQALELIKAEHPRLVFLDVMMPIMSGFDVCRTVKHEPEFAGIYVVLLTAKGQEVDRQKGAEVGADLYMTKPFDPDELLQRARQVLGL